MTNVLTVLLLSSHFRIDRTVLLGPDGRWAGRAEPRDAEPRVESTRGPLGADARERGGLALRLAGLPGCTAPSLPLCRSRLAAESGGAVH